METSTVQERQTKYCKAIEDALHRLGHTTNNQLLLVLRETYPGLSATTVHRATARLAARGKIGIAPPDRDGAMRYDANTTPHDHFLCDTCGLLRDTNVKDTVIPVLEAAIEGCRISGRLVISGTCKRCTQASE
jgi:Fur family transcriptional regulator, peroxide stress response regulator